MIGSARARRAPGKALTDAKSGEELRKGADEEVHRNCMFVPRSGNFAWGGKLSSGLGTRRNLMNGLIYLVGLIVVILAVFSFFGLR